MWLFLIGPSLAIIDRERVPIANPNPIRPWISQNSSTVELRTTRSRILYEAGSNRAVGFFKRDGEIF